MRVKKDALPPMILEGEALPPAPKNKGGRPFGSLGHRQRTVHAAIEEAFERIGGVDALVEWAQENRSDFYLVIWPKILPHQVRVAQNGPVKMVIRWQTDEA